MDGSISIYIHVPFCVRKCRYCDFPSFSGLSGRMEEYFSALFTEIREEKLTEGRTAETVYIGGGTPSCVPSLFISGIMEELHKKYRISSDAEISMEMNPGAVNPEALRAYRNAGINRVSLGCQSFNDQSLKRLGRIHSAEDIFRTFDLLRKEGFDNLNLDLISSLPGEKKEDLMRSVETALSLKPEHISVYSLILEPGTELFKEYEENRLKDLPDEDETAENDLAVREMLMDSGYSRYEISNYSLPGRECAHNRVYWNRGDYRGFGLSAASLTGNRRFSNTDELVYIKSPGKLLKEDRILSEREAMEEFMFLGLRQCSGISDTDFRKAFGISISGVFSGELRKQIKDGFMERSGDRYYYNDRGLDVSNMLLSEFILA